MRHQTQILQTVFKTLPNMTAECVGFTDSDYPYHKFARIPTSLNQSIIEL